MICAACGLTREPDDLIAFWPVGQPAQVRYACRVTRPSPVAQESCFRAVVRSAAMHEIGPAKAKGSLKLVGGFLVGDPSPDQAWAPV